MPSHSSILLLDDSPGECELFRLALTQTGLDVVLYTEQDAEAAFHFLENQYHQWSFQARSCASPEGGPNWPPTAHVERTPPAILQSNSSRVSRSASTGGHSGPLSLILLDWRLRNQHSDVFLKRLRADPRFAAIPVVVFTTSDDISDLVSAYTNGANGFVIKPGIYDQLVECVHDLCGFWLKWNRTSKELVRC